MMIPMLSRGNFRAVIEWMEEHAKLYEDGYKTTKNEMDAAAAYAIRKMIEQLTKYNR
jgi:hypothetical protein